MRQKFILEKQDMETLKNGGTIKLGFAGGGIELSAEMSNHGGSRPAKRKEDYRILLDFMDKIGKPLSAKEISKNTGLANLRVHSMISNLKAQKRIVGSSQGWRLVHNIEAKPINGNGHKVPAHVK